ncbi:glycosyltransferase [Rhodococcus sovatensis]|uniref:Glycosyltransferase n=1 Tax=Rhodococcus sovatensis TaxID=1805840 RepID=A0ABZ2PST9_9NOCA
MKFVLPFTGSRGDIAPGLALGIELAGRGHEVVFGAPPNLVTFATAATASASGISIVSFGPDTQALLESDLVRTRIKSRNPRVRTAALAELANFGWDDMTEQLSQMSVGADAAVAGTLGQEMTFNCAEALSIPFFALHYCPLRSNGSVSVLPGRELPGIVNRGTWRILESLRWRSMKNRENSQRTALGLPAASQPLSTRIARYGGIEIQAYDSSFFPGLSQEWGKRRPFVGFLELSAATTTSAPESTCDSPLRRWIDEGPPPLYFGFGSMPVQDPPALMDMIEDVCRSGGHRAVVSSGWSALDEFMDPTAAVATVGPVDHATLFPLCRAAIHHGGAGTTAASIRAGLPTMTCWFSADQPFWGAALTRTGAGTSAKFTTLTTDTLASGIATLLRTDTASRAAELADSMTPASDSLQAAADLIEGVTHQKR